MAPELLRRAKDGYCGFKADIWSLGIILFAMLSGYLPFNGECLSKNIGKLLFFSKFSLSLSPKFDVRKFFLRAVPIIFCASSGKNDDDLYNTVTTREIYFPEFVPTDVRPLITRLLDKDPKKRITLREVREDPWFVIDYVEDESVKEAKDKIKEKCECHVSTQEEPVRDVLSSPQIGSLNPRHRNLRKRSFNSVTSSKHSPAFTSPLILSIPKNRNRKRLNRQHRSQRRRRSLRNCQFPSPQPTPNPLPA